MLDRLPGSILLRIALLLDRDGVVSLRLVHPNTAALPYFLLHERPPLTWEPMGPMTIFSLFSYKFLPVLPALSVLPVLPVLWLLVL